jgi:hypothetical protein
MYGMPSMGSASDAYLLAGQVRALGDCLPRDCLASSLILTFPLGVLVCQQDPSRLPKSSKSLVKFPPGSTLFISNLGASTSEQEIAGIFGRYDRQAITLSHVSRRTLWNLMVSYA